MNHKERRREQRDGFSRNFDRHHSVAKSRAVDVPGYDVHGKHNIVIVPTNAHRNFHSFAANLLPHELGRYLGTGWIDPRCDMIAVWNNKQGVSKWLDDGRRMGFLYG